MGGLIDYSDLCKIKKKICSGEPIVFLRVTTCLIGSVDIMDLLHIQKQGISI